MKTEKEIVIHLQNAQQIMLSQHSLFYGRRMLNADAEAFIIEETKRIPRDQVISLKICLPKDDCSRGDEITASVQQHFCYRKEKAKTQLRETLRFGWRSLLMGLSFVAVLVFLMLVFDKLLPKSFSISFRELLIILGWVALWRPVELLLYEWRTFQHEFELFGRIEEAKIRIHQETIL